MEGKDLYIAYCASCHGKAGKGDGPVAPALKGSMPDLTSLARRNGGKFPMEAVEKMILEGKGPLAHGNSEMPVWGPVFHRVENDKDLGLVRTRRLTEYLISLQPK